jgi:hypothetical protein
MDKKTVATFSIFVFKEPEINFIPVELIQLGIGLLWSLTVLLHVDLQTLVEATGLALVAARDVNHAMSTLLAHVVQITANHNNDFF